ANYQLAIYYPPGWILYGLAWLGGVPWMAWGHTLLVVLHLGWAGLGMVKLAADLGVKPFGRVIAALAFALSGYLIARAGFFSMIWTAAWFPWVILYASQIGAPLSDRASKTGGISIRLVLSLAMMLLAGHAQLSWYILIFTGAWVLVGAGMQGGWRRAGPAVGLLILCGLLAGVLAGAQLAPTAEYLLQSQRSSAVDYQTALSYSFWPWRWVTLVAPDFFGNPGLGDYSGYASYWEDATYIGVLPFILAVAAIFRTLSGKGKGAQHRYKPLTLFLLGMSAVGILLAMGKFTPVFPFLYQHVPTFRLFNAPARFLIWFVFSLALLAGMGADGLKRPTGRALYWSRLATMGGLAVTVGALIAWLTMGEVGPTFIRATAMAGVWALGAGLLILFNPEPDERRVYWWQAGVVIWISLDLLVANWSITPATDAQFYAPESIARARADLEIPPGRYYLSPSADYDLKYRRFIRFSDYRPIEDVTHLLTAGIPNLNLLETRASANNFDPLVPERYAKWMEYLDRLPRAAALPWLQHMGVTSTLEIDLQTPLGIRVSPVEGSHRVQWYPCSRFAGDEETAWAMMVEKMESGSARRDELIVESPDLEKTTTDCRPTTPPRLELHDETMDSLQIEVETDLPGFVLIANTYYPGWTAWIDGQQTQLVRGDYLFMAVYVPEGIHTVSLMYRPLSHWIGLALSAAGLAGLLLVVYKRRKQLK
ncbi:MAG: YfhO family protein, partial [Chloroflexi bacterium]|nr:YfhO family protein [Chloroflexota bacterium]